MQSSAWADGLRTLRPGARAALCEWPGACWSLAQGCLPAAGPVEAQPPLPVPAALPPAHVSFAFSVSFGLAEDWARCTLNTGSVSSSSDRRKAHVLFRLFKCSAFILRAHSFGFFLFDQYLTICCIQCTVQGGLWETLSDSFLVQTGCLPLLALGAQQWLRQAQALPSWSRPGKFTEDDANLLSDAEGRRTHHNPRHSSFQN